MRTICTRGLTLGTGLPKICAPLTAGSREALLEEASHFKDYPVDLAEWRADGDAEDRMPEDYAKTLRALRRVLGNTPLLFTLRRESEGGRFKGSEEEYQTILEQLLETECIDIVDLEASIAKARFRSLAEKARREGVFVLASSHDFTGTPSEKEILDCMNQMEESAADMTKLAVMPKTEGDVRTLLRASERWKEQASRPFLMISMGVLGTRSRIGSEIYGSAITFGSVGGSSAPGQLSVPLLHRALLQVHEDLRKEGEAAVCRRLEDGFYTKA